MASYAFDPNLIVGFLLLTARMMAMLQFAPPFSSGGVSTRVRLAIAAGTGLALAPLVAAEFELSSYGLVAAVIYQIVVGAAMGVIISLFMAALTAAGSMIDLLSGIGVAVLYDPTTQIQAGPVGRLYQLVMVTGLFIIDGHLLIVRGLLRTFDAAPLQGLDVTDLSEALTSGARDLLIAAAEISLPVLVALAMTEVVLALASRAAPKLNVLVLGFAAKAMIMLLVLTVSIPLAVRSISALLERSVVWSLQVLGG